VRLKGKRVLISGGGSGIGRATAIIFAREGATVAVAGRNEDRLEEVVSTVESAGGDCHAIKCDVSVYSDVKRAVEESIKKMNSVDILFNNAGIYSYRSVEETDEELWNRILDTNLKGCFQLSKIAAGEMKKNGGGVIINNSSSLGINPVANTVAYSASKAGLISLTKSMALEFAKDKIRVNCICPGVVNTPIHEKMHGEQREEFLKTMAERHPLGSIGSPEDIAWAALFLASEEARWITGAVLAVDGGISCGS